MSFLGAMMVSAQLGLEPGGALQHCWLIPRKGQVCFQLGYRGMIELARRSGQIVSLSAQAVHEHDVFKYELGLNEALKHEPKMDGDRGKLVAVYAVAKLVGGGHQIGVMSKSDVDKIRAKYVQSSSQAWNDHYEEMAKKTVLRQLFKYLPVSVEMQTAIAAEEAADKGKFESSRVLSGGIEEGFIFDNETGEVIEDQAPPKSQGDQLAESLAK